MAKELEELSITQQSCCTSRTHVPVDHPQIEEASRMFAALADPTRLAILKLLVDHQEEVCVCDITDNFHLQQSTISHHLKLLRVAHLVNTSKRGKWVFYSLQEENAEKVRQLLKAVLPEANVFQCS
jgi:ArsR family transcriptional regulator, arsenate/arsenite/antimonite-responsive transcriptional repressor